MAKKVGGKFLSGGGGASWHPEGFLSKYDKAIDANVERAAIILERAVIGSFQSRGTQGTLSGGPGVGADGSSDAGQPPAVQTGRLAQSINHRRLRRKVQRVGSTLKPQGGARASYALLLEFGIGPSAGRYVPALNARVQGGTHPGFAERPYWRPALKNEKRAMREAISRPIP